MACSTWPSNVRPSSGCNTFGSAERMRLPSPAARTTTVRGSLICGSLHLHGGRPADLLDGPTNGSGRSVGRMGGRRLTAHGSQPTPRGVSDAPIAAPSWMFMARVTDVCDRPAVHASATLSAMPTRRQVLFGAAATVTAVTGAGVGLI